MGTPLPTLLSQALVAFTIEADNLFEQRMPHRTTEGARAGHRSHGPWLISMPFWSTCLELVAPEGTPVGEVLDRGVLTDSFLLGTNPGMVRWGYLELTPGSSPSKRPNRSWTAAPTPAGRRAQQVWAALPGVVEARWAERWPHVPALRESLLRVTARAERDLPDHLPVNGGHDPWLRIPARPPSPVESPDLAALLAKALMMATLEVEAGSPVPLVHSANVLRPLAEGPVSTRDLPDVTGVAQETLAVMTGLLRKRALVSLSSTKVLALTDAGRRAGDAAGAAVAAVDEHWPAELRDQLELLAADSSAGGLPFAAAVRPPEGGWRSRRPTPKTLPHHPVVSHRGGYPDGS